MPIQQCQINGKTGWRWGQSGKCYSGPNGRARALRQARAIKANNARHGRDPLRGDPTRTTTLRRKFDEDLEKRINQIARLITKVIDREDVFGLKQAHLQPFIGNTITVNTRWRFLTDPNKVRAFEVWLQTNMDAKLLDMNVPEQERYWHRYTEEGFRKGAGRAFDDTKKPVLKTKEDFSFYEGGKEQFLRSSFGRSETIQKVQLLTGRVFSELEGVTNATAKRLTRILADGLVTGANPKTMARRMRDDLHFTRTQSVRIARTEIIRAHAEGQLDALEGLGVEEIGVMVEWSTAGDDRVCPLCSSMEGVILKVVEAHGLIPRHPNCRCAFVPANVGESTKGQIRGREKVDRAFKQSLKVELPKTFKRTLKRQRELSPWPGHDLRVAKKRPNPLVKPLKVKVSQKRVAVLGPQRAKQILPKSLSAVKAAKAGEGIVADELNYTWMKDSTLANEVNETVAGLRLTYAPIRLDKIEVMVLPRGVVAEVTVKTAGRKVLNQTLSLNRSAYSSKKAYKRFLKDTPQVARAQISDRQLDILVHEFAHLLDNTYGSTTASKKLFKTHFNKFSKVSLYAKTNADEAVAELFVIFNRGGAKALKSINGQDFSAYAKYFNRFSSKGKAAVEVSKAVSKVAAKKVVTKVSFLQPRAKFFLGKKATETEVELMRQLNKRREQLKRAARKAKIPAAKRTDVLAIQVEMEKWRKAVRAKQGTGTLSGIEARLAELTGLTGKKLVSKVAVVAKPKSAAKPKASRLSTKFSNDVKKSRVNGRVLRTDKDEIEDMGLLIWEELDASGKTVTKMSGKLTDKGHAKIAKSVNLKEIALGGVRDDLAEDFFVPFDNMLKDAVKHTKDRKFSKKHLKSFFKAKEDLVTLSRTEDVKGSLKLSIGQKKIRRQMQQHYLKIAEDIEDYLEDIKELVPGLKVPKIKKFVVPKRAQPTALRGTVFKNDLDVKTIKKGSAKMDREGGQELIGKHTFIEMEGNVTVRYHGRGGKEKVLTRGTQRNAKALEGRVEITVPGGASPKNIQKGLDSLSELGINTAVPTAEYEELVYLLKGVRIRKLQGSATFKKIIASEGSDAQKVTKLKAWIKKDLKIDVDTVAGYNPSGVAGNQFGDGQRTWQRWDLSEAIIEEEMKEYGIFHISYDDVEDTLDAMLESGGQATSTTERIRRGIDITEIGMSSGTDLDTGGADYFFARIKKLDAKDQVFDNVFVFKNKVLGRQDAWSLGADKYGNTDLITAKKTAFLPKEWKGHARDGNNEVMFKHSLSLLDDLDFIQVKSGKQRDAVLKVMKKHKFKPSDGRSLKELVKLVD